MEFKRILGCMKKLSSLLSGKGKMNVKDTIIVHPVCKRAKYFRGDEMLEALTNNSKEIEGLFQSYCIDLSNKAKIQDFVSM